MARADGGPGASRTTARMVAGRPPCRRAREEGAAAGRGSGTRNPRLNVLIVGAHGCSFVCEWT